MIYRHAFHAGGFADVIKHIVLVRMLLYLQEKQAAFRVIDTHAGAGLYDLTGEEARRGGEWLTGIARIMQARFSETTLPLVMPYLDIVRAFNPGRDLAAYPGSPLIARALLRPQDRLTNLERTQGLLPVMAGLVPAIHGFGEPEQRKRRCPGHRRAQATPSFGRLCPGWRRGKYPPRIGGITTSSRRQARRSISSQARKARSLFMQIRTSLSRVRLQVTAIPALLRPGLALTKASSISAGATVFASDNWRNSGGIFTAARALRMVSK
jgi:hypothetical protein